MQRKDIDQTEFADLEAGLIAPSVSEGDIRIVSGQHGAYGTMILIAAAGAYAVLGNDVRLIPGIDETIETDMVA